MTSGAAGVEGRGRGTIGSMAGLDGGDEGRTARSSGTRRAAFSSVDSTSAATSVGRDGGGGVSSRGALTSAGVRSGTLPLTTLGAGFGRSSGRGVNGSESDAASAASASNLFFRSVGGPSSGARGVFC